MGENPLAFRMQGTSSGDAQGSVTLAKLHGSVDTDIVPPTWNKRIHDYILPAWQAAFEAVAEANELRFIGYSLPETDSYFRYFLKAAISQSFNLQRVDVLCRGAQVEQRYAALFESNRFRFNAGVSTDSYLHGVMSAANSQFGRSSTSHRFDTDILEQAHRMSFR
jgi:hypothetical protein